MEEGLCISTLRCPLSWGPDISGDWKVQTIIYAQTIIPQSPSFKHEAQSYTLRCTLEHSSGWSVAPGTSALTHTCTHRFPDPWH